MSRKNEILDALIDIFQTQGIGKDFTIKELATKVNIGKSTIYEYFKTKDEILQEALCRVVDKSVDEIQNATIVEGTFEMQMKNEFIRLFNIAKNSRFLFQLVSPNPKTFAEQHNEEMRKKIKNIQVLYQNRFQQLIMKGIEEGTLQSELVLENALVIYSLVVGSILTLANSNLEVSANVNIDEYIDKVYHTILKVTN